MEEPILWYHDPKKTHVSFTDATKYVWVCMSTQYYEHEIDEKEIEILNPITYIPGLF